jgi:hypothetical protein
VAPGEVPFGRVNKRLHDKYGLPVGTANVDPMLLDLQVYELGFKDGYKTLLAADTIAESLHALFVDDWNGHMLFHKIL